MSRRSRTLVWFRGKDLRIADHEPLVRAAADGEVIPVFVFDPYFFHPQRARKLPHRMQFLLESVKELSENLASAGSRLVCLPGRSSSVIPEIVEAWNVSRVVAHRWVEPFGRVRDARIAKDLTVPFDLYEGETLHPPGQLRSGKGDPYSVFTPFSRAFRREATIPQPIPAPRDLGPVPRAALTSPGEIPTLAQLGIQENQNLQQGGEAAGKKRLSSFIKKHAADYARGRDQLGAGATSRLSADIKFGTLSIRTVWWAVQEMSPALSAESLERFLTELIWREFSYSSLWDRPELLRAPFRPAWTNFPWRDDPEAWEAWAGGRTGYPIIDAAARQLAETGFIHGRARMITASFLCKHLMLDYRRGEAHFMRYLTDGDWAQNNAGWQWSAGCGCDAQPYFRVFNPVSQGKRFDPDGNYVRRWLPALSKLPARYIHQPWLAPPDVLCHAEVQLGHDYPEPIIDHAFARNRFLSAAKAHLHRTA